MARAGPRPRLERHERRGDSEPVEVALMAEHYFAVAKSYMLYRQKHAGDCEGRGNSIF